MPSNDYVDRDIKSQMWNNGRSEHTAEAKAFRAAAEHKKKLAKKMSSVDAKYDKINKDKGLTAKGKRKWHYYNTKIK